MLRLHTLSLPAGPTSLGTVAGTGSRRGEQLQGVWCTGTHSRVVAPGVPGSTGAHRGVGESGEELVGVLGVSSRPFALFLPQGPQQGAGGSVWSVCWHGEAGTAQHASLEAITLSPSHPIPSHCAHHSVIHGVSIQSQPCLPMPLWSFPPPFPGQQSPVLYPYPLSFCPFVPLSPCPHQLPSRRWGSFHSPLTPGPTGLGVTCDAQLITVVTATGRIPRAARG